MTVFLPFDHPDLELLPWSARRALDHAGTKVSLSEWQELSLDTRAKVSELGWSESVDVEAVRTLVPMGRGVEAPVSIATPPAGSSIDAAAWARLSCVARHAIATYGRRGKLDKMRRAYEAVMSEGESQSSR